MKLSSRYPSILTISSILRFILLSSLGLAASRIVYEWVFPSWLWLARPFPILLFTLFLAFALFVLLHLTLPSLPFHLFLPLLLNFLYLFNPVVNLLQSRFLFGASLWLTAVLIIHHRRLLRPFPWFGLVFILTSLLPVYLLTMPHTVGRADTFEFQVVAPQLGIAHPTGYPLYLLLAKLFSFIPIGSVAWRINLGSAVFALAALTIIYLIVLQLDYQPLFALLAALAIGLTPTFWSQAIEAEVYALQALIVAVALWFILEIGDWRLEIGNSILILAFVIGLGLTNHLTTVFLIPASGLAALFALRRYGSPKDVYRLLFAHYWLIPKILLAAVTPLLLYAYLPLRWAAVNEERMGFGRFVDWIIGGRFQGALQWTAWLHDPTRYEVVGRLLLDNWSYVNLFVAIAGLIYLFYYRWRTAVLLFITWLGFTFYALNYYVPDLSVFLIPSQLIIGIYWAVAVMGVIHAGNWIMKKAQWMAQKEKNLIFLSGLASLAILPVFLLATSHWSQIDRSDDNNLTQWGTSVLNLPLDPHAAILADSEKIAPLYYLQQAEGVRPDLAIMVLPDEAAYRSELDGRISQQTIYLARFLPGLEGIYHLRSVGPLTEVSTEPLIQLPDDVARVSLNIGEIELLGYTIGEIFEQGTTAVTLYWRANQPIDQLQHVYLRWEESQIVTTGQHPANNNYPTLAWDVNEIVSDFHLIPNPLRTSLQQRALQVALAPPFTPANQLDWHFVALIDLPANEQIADLRPLRIQIDRATISGSQYSSIVRPQTALALTTVGFGLPDGIRYELSPVWRPTPVERFAPSLDNFSSLLAPYIEQTELDTNLANGRYVLLARAEPGAICGWLQPVTDSCQLGQVEVTGVPLPPQATNYEDKIALLEIELSQTELKAGAQLPITLYWQSLSAMDKDYTVFIQLLNEQDQIVSQIDAWPLQGTFPTSQWTPGAQITDPYNLQLGNDLPSGRYRLLIGWYLLADARRLSILNADGYPIDDKLVIPDLFVP